MHIFEETLIGVTLFGIKQVLNSGFFVKIN
jgi:hypothetical protein